MCPHGWRSDRRRCPRPPSASQPRASAWASWRRARRESAAPAWACAPSPCLSQRTLARCEPPS
eukprot:3636190-Prymnesium_polylepis.1